MSVGLQPTPLFRLMGPEKAGGIETSANVLAFLGNRDIANLSAVFWHRIDRRLLVPSVTKEEKILAKILRNPFISNYDLQDLIKEIPEFILKDRVQMNFSQDHFVSDFQLQERLTVQKDGTIVSRFPNAISLKLSHSWDLSNGGLACLQYVPKLESLNLWGCKLSDDDLVHLQYVPQLKSLNLGRCQITIRGLESLSYLPYLECIDLDSVDLTNEDLERIVQLCPNLKRLVLYGNERITSLQPIVQLSKLEHLDISHCHILDDEELAHLPMGLLSLNAMSCGIRDRGLEHIAARQTIRELDIRCNPRIANVNPIAHSLPQLEVLSLRLCEDIEDFIPLHSLTQLRILDVSYCLNIKRALSRLVPFWGRMEELDLTGCKLWDEHCDSIARLTQLRKLDISSNSVSRGGITNQGIGKMCQLENLTNLGIKGWERVSMTTREIYEIFPKLRKVYRNFGSSAAEDYPAQVPIPTTRYTAQIAAVACAAIAVIGAYFYRL